MRTLLWIPVFASMTLNYALAAELQVSKNDCRYLVAHQPRADVTYQPGVDARGRDVAPADINTSPSLGDNITIPLQVDLAQKFGVNLGKVDASKATVGIVTIDGGRAYLNGQPLSDENQQNLAVLCLEANGKQP